MRRILGFLTPPIVIVALFYLMFVHYTDINQAAIVRNSLTGEVVLDTVPGLDLSAPWRRVARIDLRPQRVCISSASRAYNCKLVQFKPRAYREFVKVQGFGYYWWANRISFNSGYNEEYRGMRDLLRGYAYGTEEYPFISVIT